MRNKPRWVWPLLVISLILATVLIALICSTPRSPRYQGKKFYHWAAELQQAQVNYNDAERNLKMEVASVAIRAMGTNGLPLVMDDLRARATVKDKVLNWLVAHARFLRLKPPLSASDRWVRGIRAMEVMGPLGKPYLPELITMVSNSTGYSEGALLAVGPDALPAFTNFLTHSRFPQTGNLIGAFANAVYANRITPDQAEVALPSLVKVFQSTDSHGRWYAAGAFGAIHEEPDLCVPLLIAGLADPTPSVREACVQSLGAFGEAASQHAGKLVEIFPSTDSMTRAAICRAVGNFGSATPICVPLLVEGASDSDQNVRLAAVVSLGQLSAKPEQAIPVLIQAVQDTNQVIRLMAAQSLGQFGSRGTNALPILERACSDSEASVRNIAATAIKRIKEGW